MEKVGGGRAEHPSPGRQYRGERFSCCHMVLTLPRRTKPTATVVTCDNSQVGILFSASLSHHAVCNYLPNRLPARAVYCRVCLGESEQTCGPRHLLGQSFTETWVGFPGTGWQARPRGKLGHGHPRCRRSITRHGHSCAFVPQPCLPAPRLFILLEELPTTLLSAATLVFTETWLIQQKKAYRFSLRTMIPNARFPRSLITHFIQVPFGGSSWSGSPVASTP